MLAHAKPGPAAAPVFRPEPLMLKVIEPAPSVNPRTVLVGQSPVLPTYASSQSWSSVQRPKSPMTWAFAIVLFDRSRTMTVNEPEGSVTPAFWPTSFTKAGFVEFAGLGTCWDPAIAAAATRRPHADRSVALRTKPVIVAPP